MPYVPCNATLALHVWALILSRYIIQQVRQTHLKDRSRSSALGSPSWDPHYLRRYNLSNSLAVDNPLLILRKV